jgi:ring-1,2-phenylacetyl-CoA epoxidase subunit PaaC
MIDVSADPHVQYLLRRADDALILGHRLSEWCGHAPMMEEDMALANMGLDLLGQARSLYTHAGAIEGSGHDEDAFAYLRRERDFRNLLLVEQPNGDFARTMLRQFFYAAYADPFWRAATASADPGFAAIAAKAEKEMAYHLRHSAEWVVRLADGTAESRRRIDDALATLWPYTGEMFATDTTEQAMRAAGIAPDPERLRATWNETISVVFTRATLPVPAEGWMQQGGRQGRHGESLGHLLAELQYLQRAIPGATW